MPPKVFLLGATGFIGGDFLFTLVDAHSDYDLTCLVRNSDRGAQVASQYPKAKLVYGTLEDSDILGREAAQADIVLNLADSNHGEAARAIIRGLGSKESGKPGFYIHTSGISILMYSDIDRKTCGEAASKTYDDWDGIGEVTSLPNHAPHRNVDKIVIDAGDSMVKTAVVCPPTIYGVGRGPGNQRSDQVPDMVKYTLERKQAFHVGAGENFGPNVSIRDLSSLYIKLVEAAAAENGGNATWNREGYYFAENGEHVWGQVSKAIAKAGFQQGLLSSDEVVPINEREADELMNRGAVLWGGNARSHAIRGRKLLDWAPKIKSFDAYISEAVTTEAKNMGLMKGHAAQVAI